MQDGQGIVIDLDFEKQMTETEIKSLCGQLQYCYASNTRSAVPCHLYFTSLQVHSPPLIYSLAHPFTDTLTFIRLLNQSCSLIQSFACLLVQYLPHLLACWLPHSVHSTVFHKS